MERLPELEALNQQIATDVGAAIASAGLSWEIAYAPWIEGNGHTLSMRDLANRLRLAPLLTLARLEPTARDEHWAKAFSVRRAEALQRAMLAMLADPSAPAHACFGAPSAMVGDGGPVGAARASEHAR